MNRHDAQQQLTALAQAMRAGANLRPQHHAMKYFEGEGSELRSCALAAAYEGAGNRLDVHPGLITQWLYFTYPVLDADTSDRRRASLYGLIVDRNSAETREQIADWLEHAAVDELVLED